MFRNLAAVVGATTVPLNALLPFQNLLLIGSKGGQGRHVSLVWPEGVALVGPSKPCTCSRSRREMPSSRLFREMLFTFGAKNTVHSPSRQGTAKRGALGEGRRSSVRGAQPGARGTPKTGSRRNPTRFDLAPLSDKLPWKSVALLLSQIHCSHGYGACVGYRPDGAESLISHERRRGTVTASRTRQTYWTKSIICE